MKKGRVEQLVGQVLRHMARKQSGNQKAGLLLSGDPGIGKTTFVELLGALLGLKTVVVEVPHIVEEHLINIPFLVFDPVSNTVKRGIDQVDTHNKYQMVLAQSHLYSQIVSTQVMPDEKYLQYLNQSPAEVQHLFTNMGGTMDKIPQAIGTIRDSTHSILFLDEYYRQTSTHIRNILRDILNNKIGMHKLPSSAYVIYASNMADEGLEGDIPSNNQFWEVEFEAPTKDEWFGWFWRKYGKRKDLGLNEQVVRKFQDLLEDQDISANDVEADVRTSPRRWEQLLLYIASSLPTADPEEARAIVANVKNSFLHYQTGAHAGLANKVVTATQELIQATSGHTDTDAQEVYQWRYQLEHIVKQQMKTGGARKHVPVVSGPPGIGKTLYMQQIANSLGLRLIDLDVSSINAEDVTGIPIPGAQKEEGMDVKFSRPKLYEQIMRYIAVEDKAHIEDLKAEHGANANQYIEQYQNARWKYLIFFDELNRVHDQRAFNALRRVILEKNFGPADANEKGETLSLPREAIVVGAINPEGTGTQEMTKHFRDVLDIIPARGRWGDFVKYLKAMKLPGVDPAIQSAAFSIMTAFIDNFKDKGTGRPAEEAPFHLDVGTEIYVAPREYSDLYATLADELNAKMKEIVAEMSEGQEFDRDEALAEMQDTAGRILTQGMRFIFRKHTIEADEFFNTVRVWVETLDPAIFSTVFGKVVETKAPYEETLGAYLKGKNVLSMPEDVELTNLNDQQNHAQIIEKTTAMLHQWINSKEAVDKYILDETHPKITLAGDRLQYDESQKASLFENFAIALIYSLQIHEYQADRLHAVSKSVRLAASQIVKNLKQEKKLDPEAELNVREKLITIASELHEIILSSTGKTA